MSVMLRGRYPTVISSGSATPFTPDMDLLQSRCSYRPASFHVPQYQPVSVFVANISKEVTRDGLGRAFSIYGVVLNAQVTLVSGSGLSSGVVTFLHRTAAERAAVDTKYIRHESADPDHVVVRTWRRMMGYDRALTRFGYTAMAVSNVMMPSERYWRPHDVSF
ncbi:hypothetical protein QBC34DRAFT_444287 [Podospora aff. communis PSN243]|uniref:RRM domain-containing protein n=1 Tax=Podospora aff. communis PSN243 TaxID=3040156 RepID=A0AAV9G4G1_9PEZI|nr:hypothetical protein QBC34DRAFT_444287 [Podospora aff. communis PSN243]